MYEYCDIAMCPASVLTTVDETVAAVAAICRDHQSEAWLFGSQARHEAHAGSDIDIDGDPESMGAELLRSFDGSPVKGAARFEDKLFQRLRQGIQFGGNACQFIGNTVDSCDQQRLFRLLWQPAYGHQTGLDLGTRGAVHFLEKRLMPESPRVANQWPLIDRACWVWPAKLVRDRMASR